LTQHVSVTAEDIGAKVASYCEDGGQLGFEAGQRLIQRGIKIVMIDSVETDWSVWVKLEFNDRICVDHLLRNLVRDLRWAFRTSHLIKIGFGGLVNIAMLVDR
jgi:hypothetical protein